MVEKSDTSARSAPAKISEAPEKGGETSREKDLPNLTPAMGEQLPGLQVRSGLASDVAKREEEFFAKGFSFDKATDPFAGGPPADGTSRQTPPLDGQLTPNGDPNLAGNPETAIQQRIPEFTLLSDTSKLDPKKPTVAFLDVFGSEKLLRLTGRTGGLDHGEVSQSAADASGDFNTLALQANITSDDGEYADFSKVLNDINTAVDKGELQLGRGDVLNISMGQRVSDPNRPDTTGDPTFKKASDLLGFTGDKALTPNNLAEMRPQILERAKALSEDPSVAPEQRAAFKRVVDTNEAIDKLQAKGIEVVQAAGNDGPDRFSWDFMNAKHQLSGLLSDGTVAPRSALNSLTTAANEVVTARFKAIDLFSPQKIEDQTGKFTLGEKGLELPAEKFGRRFSTAFTQEVSPGVFRDEKPKQMVPPELFSPVPLSEKPQTFSGTASGDAKITGPKSALDTDILRFGIGPSQVPPLTAQEEERGRLIAGFKGTSFSNIDFLPTQAERLERIKTIGRDRQGL